MSLTLHFHPLERPRSITADFRKCYLPRYDTMRPDTAAITPEIILPEVSVPQNPNRLL